MAREASPLLFNIEHVKLLNSSPSPFDSSSETTSNLASKMLAIELFVGRQFKLEIFCSNVYAEDDGTTILEPVERIKDIKACEKTL